jgi:hypothetical protein
MVIYTSTVATNLKPILEDIGTDKSDGLDAGLVMRKYFWDGESQKHAYDIDLQMGGPALATEKPEGDEVSVGAINEGYQSVYVTRTFGLKLIITEEAKEDSLYDEVINTARYLKISLFKTVEYDAAAVLARGFNTAYVGGDGLPLWSASHTLPGGGTYSNLMAVPMSPSVQAVETARAQAMKYPALNGLIEGFQLNKVVFPTEQWGAWQRICGSSMSPEAGNFAAINVVNQKMSIEPVEVKYWTNTTTNYMFLTDIDKKQGLKWKWKRRPKMKTWLDNDQEVEKASMTGRWSRLWSDPRCTLGVQA